MVAKVNVLEAVNRLTICPVCGAQLGWSPDYPLEKSCDCGDFTIVDVWADGDVSFEFKMASLKKVEADSRGSSDGGV